jgi:hypothetical protein
MAIPSSSSDATSSSESDTESSTTNYGHIADEPVHFSYRNGALAWASSSLKDEDIITVTRASNIEHTIFSLAPADDKKPFELRTTNATTLPQAFLDKHLFQALPSHLQPDNNIHVLISTLSGTGLSPEFFDEVLHPILRAIGLVDSQYHVVRTSSAESVVEFARSTLLVAANQGRKQTVVMLSGDGGMVDTINGLLEGGHRSRYFTPLELPRKSKIKN